MLAQIQIKNFLLVEYANIELSSGLVIITGQTGAGKSLIINALMFALGHKSVKLHSGLLPNPKEDALVVACFDLERMSEALKVSLEEIGIDLKMEQLIVRRAFGVDGRSRCFINDIPVSLKSLSILQDELLEICGQNASRTLNEPKQQMLILDQYCQNHELLQQVGIAYYEFTAAKKAYDMLDKDFAEIEVEKSFLSQAIAELKSLEIKPNEEEELLQKRELAKQQHKASQVFKTIEGAIAKLNFDSEISVLKRELARLPAEMLAPLMLPLDKAASEFMEFHAQFEDLVSNIVHEGDLQSIEDRLFKIRGIARKYNVMSQQLSDFLQKKQMELQDLENIGERKQKAQHALLKARERYLALACSLSQSRLHHSKALAQEIQQHLHDLKMPLAEMKILVESDDKDETHFTSSGIDYVRLIVRTNNGLPFAELGKSTSGGETARIMLAIKLVMARLKDVGILIFDEVDSGISGAVSTAVGKKLAVLSEYCQVIVITHQAQVAAFARQHLLVSKESSSNATTATITALSDAEHEYEVARLISGENVTSQSLEAARSIIETPVW
jgi:DNA repair protein RecN (Recombination protein N)